MPMMKETMLKRLLLPIAAAGGGGSAPVQDTATGNPLAFITDKAKPLKSLLIPFTPQQEGTGDPSPQNIRSILPWNGLNVWNGGKNLIDDSKKYSPGASMCYIGQLDANYHMFLKAGQYTISCEYEDGEHYGMYYQESEDSSDTRIWAPSATITEATFTLSKDGIYKFFAYRSTSGGGVDSSKIRNIMLEAGESVSAYEPYTPITETDIPFASPVYGGTLDVVSGVMTVEWVCYDLSDFTWEEYSTNRVRTSFLMDKPIVYPETSNDYPEVIAEEYIPLKQSGSLASNHNGIIIMPRSSETAGRILMYFDGENYPSGKACFKLATPQAVTLTPTKITAIVGDNTIWTDADGEMTATYLKKA